jgi:hypothetical protein
MTWWTGHSCSLETAPHQLAELSLVLFEVVDGFRLDVFVVR